MLLFLSKWMVASLVVPVLVLAFPKFVSSMQMAVLAFWPGSIMLMSLGSEPRTLSDVVYVWAMAVCSNILLYIILGSTVYYLKSKF